jgi:hypothetical protein
MQNYSNTPKGAGQKAAAAISQGTKFLPAPTKTQGTKFLPAPTKMKPMLHDQHGVHAHVHTPTAGKPKNILYRGVQSSKPLSMGTASVASPNSEFMPVKPKAGMTYRG